MKKYLQKTMQDTFITWLTLEISIVISAILYAILKVAGASDNSSLLTAFIVLIGLIILGLIISPTNPSKLGRSLKKGLHGKQLLSKQLETLIAQQNLLIEKLNRSLDTSALSSVRSSISEPSLDQSQQSGEFTFKLNSQTLDVLYSFLKNQESMMQYLDNTNQIFRNIFQEQKEISAKLEQSQQEEITVLKQLSEYFEKENKNKTENETKTIILGNEGRTVYGTDIAEIAWATSEGHHIIQLKAGNEGIAIKGITPDEHFRVPPGEYFLIFDASTKMYFIDSSERMILQEYPPHMAIYLNNQAAVYTRQDKYTQAESFYQHALHITNQVLGQKHPAAAIVLNNLAGLYFNQGKYEQAEPLYQRALEIMEKTLGQEHTNTTIVLNNLAELYFNQGKYEQAEPLYQLTLEIMEKTLGPEHLKTKIVRKNYNMLRESMKQKKG